MNGSIRNVFAVFLASPGDLSDERRQVAGVVEEINRSSSRIINWQIDLLGWEDTLPGQERPQSLINPEVDRCDLFLGLLWRRWGSPTGEYSSGFEEEFDLALRRRLSTRQPDLALYFKSIDPDQLLDPGEQLQKVIGFRDRIKRERLALYAEFSDSSDLAGQLRALLWSRLLQAHETLRLSDSASGLATPTVREIVSPTAGLDPNRMEDEGERQALAALASMERVLAHGDDQAPSHLSLARAKLVVTSMFASTYSGESVGVAEVGVLYRSKDQISLSRLERRELLRSLARDRSQVLAGWAWFKEEPGESLISELADIAAADSDVEVRQGALRLLSLEPEFVRRFAPSLVTALLQSDVQAIGDELSGLFASLADDDPHRDDLLSALVEATQQLGEEEADRLAIAILLPTDAVGATERLLQSSYWPSKHERVLLESASALPDTLLDRALHDSRLPVREIAVTVALRQQASPAVLRPMLADSNGAIRERVLAHLIRLSEFGFDERLKLIEEAGVGKEEIGINIAHLRVDAFRALSREELTTQLAAGGYDSAFALEALAEAEPTLLDTLRADLAEAFAGRLAQWRSTTFDQIMKPTTGATELTSIDSLTQLLDDSSHYIQEMYINAALRILGTQGSPEDSELVRPFLNSPHYPTQIAAIRTIARIGSSEDVDSLVAIARNGKAIVTEEAAVAAVRLGGVKAASQLVAFRAPLIFKPVVREVLAMGDSTVQDEDLARELVDSLLDDNVVVREAAARFLAVTLPPELVSTLLSLYQENGRYYYNVVGILDRVGLSPEPFAAAFKSSSRRWLAEDSA